MKLVGSVRGKCCVLNNPVGRNKMHSVFEGFFFCQCAFRVQTEKSGQSGVSFLFQCQSYIQIKMRRHLYKSYIID